MIIVFTHWGFEYKKLPNQAQKQLTELCFKNGVQLVIGSHPHVLQPIEFRSDTTLVAYSLGNYISNMRKRYMDGGMMLEVELQKDSTGVTIKNAGYHLGWVYTTPEPAHQFYILPTSAYEYDSTFVLEEDSRTRMKTFATDSRNLLITNNINVNEIKVFPQLVRIDSAFGFNGSRFKKSILVPEVKSILESETKSTQKKIIAKDQVPAVKKNNLQRFRVQIMVTSSDIKPEHIPHQYNKSVFKEEVKGLFKYQIGEWSSRNEAEGHLKIIRSITGYEDAFIVIHK